MAIKIKIPYDLRHEALWWAKQNCPSYITNSVHLETSVLKGTIGSETYINYHFANETDATLFALRWIKS
jgi:hypothetical protein